MIKFRFISLNSEGFLIQPKGPMVRFINYFSIVENMSNHYTGLIRLCIIIGIYNPKRGFDKLKLFASREVLMDYRFCVI